MDIREKMHSGDLYLSMDEDLFNEQLTYLDKLYDFNATRPSELPKRTEMLKNMFAEIGEDCYIEPPLHANWAGRFVHFGKGVYANFNLTLVDDTVNGIVFLNYFLVFSLFRFFEKFGKIDIGSS